MSDARNALVVDDHPTNRLLATALLTKLGWTVSEAHHGEQALEQASQQDFRLILLDISMPGITGEETCRRLRALPAAQPVFIAAYTAHAFPEDIDKLLASGFDDVLVKPISRQRLEALTVGL